MTRIALLLALLLAGCAMQQKGSPLPWYSSQNAVPPRGNTVSVCHAFGCHLKTSFTFAPADIRRMRRYLRKARSPAAEREAIRALVAWAEKRVAPSVGSAHDVGGLDLQNAGVTGQMDCIDEAANTTSYLLVAAHNGLLRYHKVARPVARGYFLDGRYPHATAVIVAADGVAWAVDSWREPNGAEPEVMPLDQWFDESPAR